MVDDMIISLYVDKASFLKSNRMICVYRYVVIPSLILSLSVTDVLDIAVLRCVLDLLRVFWAFVSYPFFHVEITVSLSLQNWVLP